jgi:transcriptional regulator with XRE-family HTH domain
MQSSLGRAVRAVRLAKGYSQEEVAERASLSRGYLTNIEAGRRDPTWSTMQMLCDGLGVPLTTLVILSEAGDNERVRNLLPFAMIEMV